VRNWAGNVDYHAQRFARPTSTEELAELVSRSTTVKAVGSRHSFNDSADTTGTQVSIEDLRREVSIDRSSDASSSPRQVV
jgi:xylitol oxidase